MTTVIVILSLAYAAVAALLLNLNLATQWSGAVKTGAIVLVSGLYVGAWQGHQDLLRDPLVVQSLARQLNQIGEDV